MHSDLYSTLTMSWSLRIDATMTQGHPSTSKDGLALWMASASYVYLTRLADLVLLVVLRRYTLADSVVETRHQLPSPVVSANG
jgi:hypothetical protein